MSIAESSLTTPSAVSTLDELIYELGDIPLDRILTRPPPGTATEDDLLNCSLNCELVDGTLVVKTMGFSESVLALILGQWINNYLDQRPLGACAGEQGICRLIPGLVRAPDVSFITRERLSQAKTDLTFAPGAPDLCVEVLSKKNTRREINRKLKEYFKHGARLAWVIDFRKQIAEVYLAPVDPVLVKPFEIMEGRDVLPGFQFVLGDLFIATEQRLQGMPPDVGDVEKSAREQPQP